MLKRLCKPLVVAALCFSNTLAIASDWVAVSTDDNKNVVSVDTSSIAPKGKYTKAWLLWNYDTQQILEEVSPSKKYYSSKGLTYFDCTEGTSALIQITYYEYQAGVGVPVQSLAFDSTKVRYQDFVPDTMGEAIHKFVCKNSRNKLTKQRS